jgi:crotonobetainyl-CoA:carnitine CoA-transferase CaiB-like acyl-CoA transferase
LRQAGAFWLHNRRGTALHKEPDAVCFGMAAGSTRCIIVDCASQPMEGVRVLDLTRHVAGPFCTKLLADYGADVIKIEQPGRGDPARWIGPFAGGLPNPERSGLFLHLNTNKRSLTLDLKSATGREIFLKLARRADILVENFRAGVMDALGLDYATLRTLNPALVMTSISNFGQTGPYRDWSASELVLYAMGHEMWGTGSPDAEPAGVANKLNLHLAGQAACLAALCAYYGAQLSGAGAHIDLSIMEVLAAAPDRRGVSLVAYQYCGDRMRRQPAIRGIDPPPFLNRCADGLFEISVGIERWDIFVRAVAEDWVMDPIFRPPTRDRAISERFNSFWQPWCMARSKRELTERFQKGGLPCAPLNTVADLAGDEQLIQRDFFARIDHPAAGPFSYPGAPFKMEWNAYAIRRPAPLLGQHNAEILGELGYGAADLSALSAAAVI